MAISRQQVIDESLLLVDAEGLDSLTLRALASRLGVQAPTLYWHVKNKADLLDALSDAILDEALAGFPETTGEWLLTAMSGLRRALLAHRDGARVVSGARGSLRRADFSERAISRLVEEGSDLQLARLTVLVAERYTTGFVLEEQSPPPVAEPNVDEIQRRLPTVTRAIIAYFGDGKTVDDLYLDGLRLILE